jgi:putative transposase
MDEGRLLLTDKIWSRIAAALAGLKSKRGAPPALTDRDFVEAVLYLARTGVPWRDLPDRFGKWDAVYQRFRRWLDRGVWRGLLAAVPGKALTRIRVLFADSTVIRAHQHAAGAPKKGAARRPRRSAAAGAGSRPSSTPPRRTSGRRSP